MPYVSLTRISRFLETKAKPEICTFGYSTSERLIFILTTLTPTAPALTGKVYKNPTPTVSGEADCTASLLQSTAERFHEVSGHGVL